MSTVCTSNESLLKLKDLTNDDLLIMTKGILLLKGDNLRFIVRLIKHAQDLFVKTRNAMVAILDHFVLIGDTVNFKVFIKLLRKYKVYKRGVIQLSLMYTGLCVTEELNGFNLINTRKQKKMIETLNKLSVGTQNSKVQKIKDSNYLLIHGIIDFKHMIDAVTVSFSKIFRKFSRSELSEFLSYMGADNYQVFVTFNEALLVFTDERRKEKKIDKFPLQNEVDYYNEKIGDIAKFALQKENIRFFFSTDDDNQVLPMLKKHNRALFNLVRTLNEKSLNRLIRKLNSIIESFPSDSTSLNTYDVLKAIDAFFDHSNLLLTIEHRIIIVFNSSFLVNKVIPLTNMDVVRETPFQRDCIIAILEKMYSTEPRMASNRIVVMTYHLSISKEFRVLMIYLDFMISKNIKIFTDIDPLMWITLEGTKDDSLVEKLILSIAISQASWLSIMSCITRLLDKHFFDRFKFFIGVLKLVYPDFKTNISRLLASMMLGVNPTSATDDEVMFWKQNVIDQDLLKIEDIITMDHKLLIENNLSELLGLDILKITQYLTVCDVDKVCSLSFDEVKTIFNYFLARLIPNTDNYIISLLGGIAARLAVSGLEYHLAELIRLISISEKIDTNSRPYILRCVMKRAISAALDGCQWITVQKLIDLSTEGVLGNETNFFFTEISAKIIKDETSHSELLEICRKKSIPISIKALKYVNLCSPRQINDLGIPILTEYCYSSIEVMCMITEF